jgi:glutamyl-tRNA synthetase
MASQELIQEWVLRSKQFEAADVKALSAPFSELDAHLTLRSYIVGYALSDADIAVFKAIKANHKATSFLKQGHLRSATRWYTYITDTNPDLASASLPVRTKEAAPKKDGDSFEIGLQDTEKGVITRFPPEPSYVFAPQQ